MSRILLASPLYKIKAWRRLSDGVRRVYAVEVEWHQVHPVPRGWPSDSRKETEHLPGGCIASDDAGLYYLSSKVQMVADLADAFRKKASAGNERNRHIALRSLLETTPHYA
jgi:hypothetical protein